MEELVRKRRRGPAKRRVLIVLTAVFLVLIICYIVIESALGGVLLRIAEARLSAMAVSALNDAIIDNLSDDIRYSDLVTIIADESGKIYMLQANTQRMNQLASKAALGAQQNIAAIGDQGISIPIGTIIGGKLFTGKGPAITVHVTPIGAVSSEFISEFKSAGINQTLHTIKIRLTAYMSVVVPSGASVKMQAEAPIAESVIVGDVPETYFNMGSSSLRLAPEN